MSTRWQDLQAAAAETLQMSDRAAAAIADLMVSDLQLRGYGSPHQPKEAAMTEPEPTDESSGAESAAAEEAPATSDEVASPDEPE